MGKFVRGQAKPANSGRKVGGRNRVNLAFRDATMRVYSEIGGDKTYADWAEDNQTEYYKIAARLIPLEMNVLPQADPDAMDLDELARRVAFALRAADAEDAVPSDELALLTDESVPAENAMESEDAATS